MSSKNWAPGFIQLTRKTGTTYWIQIAEIIRFEAGEFDGTPGSFVELKEREEERFTLETPDQIADLIRDNWEKRISGEAAMGAEYGSGDYKIGKNGWI